ncbi:MAG: hypothetical protein ACUVQG_12870 [Thermogutta sp.]
MLRRICLTLLGVSCFLAIASFGDPSIGETSYRIATFRCDVTPPADGQPLIWLVPVKEVETPLEARGIVLDDGQRRYVLCAMDWCAVCNSTHEMLQNALAEGAETRPEYVALHTVHQHTAPYTDGDAQRLLDEVNAGIRYVDFQFLDTVANRMKDSVRESLQRLQPVDQIGLSAVPVSQVASTRRAWTPDGRLVVRYSSCKDPQIRDLPEGLIDPLLRTVTFANAGRPIVRLHYYATHPQSFYGDPRASSDVPGFARSRLEQEEGVFQIYFTGCAGNVTMGKYNDGSREARDQLTERLYQAMSQARQQTKYEPLRSIAWRSMPFPFIPRSDPGNRKEDLRRRLSAPSADPVQRVRAACRLAFLQREGRPLLTQSLFLNEAVIVHLPGECFVEYQLYAQSLRPGNFVAVAAYGDCGPGYICVAKAFEEGGYEPSATGLAPENESLLKEIIAKLVKSETAQ